MLNLGMEIMICVYIRQSKCYQKKYDKLEYHKQEVEEDPLKSLHKDKKVVLV
jgi:hypothetical protein